MSKSCLNNDIKNSQALGCLRKSLIDAIDEAKLQDSNLCQTLLADSYSALAEPYAVQGCGSRRNLDLHSHMQHLLAQKEFPIALAMFDAHLNIEQAAGLKTSQNYEYYQRGLLTSMEETGLHHTLKEYQKNCQQELASWHDFDQSLQKLTGLLVDKNFAEDSFENQLHLLQSKQMDSKNVIIMTEMYDNMANLQILNEMKDFHCALESDENTGLKVLIANCATYQNDKQFMDYKYLKRILKQRCQILQGVLSIEDYNNQRNSPSKVRLSKSKAIQKISLEALITNSFQLVQNAHDNEDFGFGYKTLLELDKVCHMSHSRSSSSEFFQDKIKYEKCRLFWAWGQKDEAAKQLDLLIKHLRRKTSIPNSRCQLLPDALSLLGSWMWHLRSHSSTAILEDCFLESIRLYKEQLQEAASLTNDDEEEVKTFVNDLAEAYIRLATFCDEQYTLIVNYMNSKDYEDKQAILQEMSHDHKMMKEEKVKGTTTLVILERNSNLDKREMMAKMEERNNFLTLALENYARALANQNEKNDMKIYRWISLWFANPDNAAANQIVETALQQIPDYKFVGLLYQLCARMVTAEPTGTFSSILENLILRCGTQHPYHTLPIILALVNSNLDEVIEKKPLKAGGSSKIIQEDEENSLAPRAKVAKKVLQKLKQRRVEINDIAKKTELLSVALIQLAYKKPENDKKNSISRNDPLMKLQRMEDVLLPTHSLPISKVGGDWYFNDNHLANDFCGIARFATEYHMVGGINAPKKMSCVGTDGKSRPQLLKGRDDLRQDAVMQQVFGLINSLLKQSVPKSQLGIRTFKVVPLSQRSGILEWCVNTEPISDFLIGPDKISGAHGKYHPQEWKAKKCQAVMAEVSKKCAQKRAKAKDLHDRAKVETESKALLIKIFQDICQNFTPVFRHFFYENFPNVDQHFKRRLAYTRYNFGCHFFLPF